MKFIKKQFAKLRLKDQKLEKELANIDDEPWVKVINVSMTDPKDPSTGFFELDWNDEFVNMLKQSGYEGASEEEIVDRWFQTLCKTIGNEQGIDINASGHVKMTRRDDGKTEVS